MMRGRVYWLAATCVLGAVAAVFAAYRVSGFPPSLHSRAVRFAAAKAELLIDTPISQLTVIGNQWGDLGPPQMALNYANFLYSDLARRTAADAAGIRGSEVSVSGPFNTIPPGSPFTFKAFNTPAPVPVDNNYQLVVDVSDLEPLLTLYGQAPTKRAAFAIVNSMRALLVGRVRAQEAAFPVPADRRAVIRPLGPTTGGVIDPSGPEQVLVSVFIVVLVAGGTLRLAVERRRRWPATGSFEPIDVHGDEWPHTRRILPWSVAVFLLLLFLTPVDAFTVPVHLPLVANPDRVLLVAIALMWFCGLALASGAARPRVRLTHVHIAALAFIAVCCIGVGVNGHDLVQNQEIVPVLKKLLLLVSFILFFVIAASVLRPREVPRFITLIVILGVVVSIAALIEKETRYNVFYAAWNGILTPNVEKPPLGVDTTDSIGRLTVVGPTSQPLELAALLAMVLPFAIVRALTAGTRRRRLLYLGAVTLLVAGGFATSRKTSVVAPATAILVLMAYRPRAMLRGLAFALVPMLLAVHVLAPGQLGKLESQLLPGNLTTVGTTTHRTARYDAIRPDVFTHMLLGRGYSSYDPAKYRVLDNQYLGLLINVGVIGSLVYLSIFGGLIAAAAPLIRGPDRRTADDALAAQTALIVVLVSSFLFDAISFTHVSYLSLFIGAMILALRPARREPAPAWAIPGAEHRLKAALSGAPA